ncbi:MAG: hypothetical protein JWL63_2707 [Rhodocyclales bacterium]|nr:hypothetical protein [Rhodocyclales bacterium]
MDATKLQQACAECETFIVMAGSDICEACVCTDEPLQCTQEYESEQGAE